MIEILRETIALAEKGDEKGYKVLKKDGRNWLKALDSALMKACGNDVVLADQIFTMSLKEVLQDAGLLPKEQILKKEAGSIYKLTQMERSE